MEKGASQASVRHRGDGCEAPHIHLVRLESVVWGGMRGGHGEGWDSQSPSSHWTYTSPSGRVGVSAGRGSGDGSSIRVASPSLLFVGGVNMPEMLKSTSGWRQKR